MNMMMMRIIIIVFLLSTKGDNMTAIFISGKLLMTLQMSPANARQAIEANFKDAGELPLVFAEIPTL